MESQNFLTIKTVCSLEKILPNREPALFESGSSTFLNETFLIADWAANMPDTKPLVVVKLEIEYPLQRGSFCRTRSRQKTREKLWGVWGRLPFWRNRAVSAGLKEKRKSKKPPLCQGWQIRLKTVGGVLKRADCHAHKGCSFNRYPHRERPGTEKNGEEGQTLAKIREESKRTPWKAKDRQRTEKKPYFIG